jgi:hypothetical protein
MTKIDPQQILENYREALRRNYGDAVADNSLYGYSQGWFYFEMARECQDGNYRVFPGVFTRPKLPAFRRNVIIARTEELNRRANEIAKCVENV